MCKQIIILVLVGLGVCYSVYTINSKQAQKSVVSYYEGRQAAIDEINRFLEKK